MSIAMKVAMPEAGRPLGKSDDRSDAFKSRPSIAPR